MTGTALTVIATFEAVAAAVLLVFLARSLARAVSVRRANLALEPIRPAIHEALLTYLTGANDLETLRGFARSHRAALVEALLAFRNTVTGAARVRLWELALELALVHDWCEAGHSSDSRARRTGLERLALACAYERCRRLAGELQRRALEDPDPNVRVAAARGLAQSDYRRDLEHVFLMAIESNLLARVLLTEALRPHAAVLCESLVSETLRSGDECRVIAALDIVIAWNRAVPLLELHALIAGANPAVRLRALRVLPLVPATPENIAAAVHALADRDREVALEAIGIAGRLRIELALPDLERFARSATPKVAQAAAEAIGAIHDTRALPQGAAV